MRIITIIILALSPIIAEHCSCPPPEECPPTPICSPAQCENNTETSQNPLPLCRPNYIIVRPLDSGYVEVKNPSNDAYGLQLPTDKSINPSKSAAMESLIDGSSLPRYHARIPFSPITQQTAKLKDNLIGSEHKFRRIFARSTPPYDDVCNNGDLRKIIDENIVEGNASVSRSRIYKAFFEHAGARDQINVICSNAALSYSVVSSIYCESTVKGVTCIIFHT